MRLEERAKSVILLRRGKTTAAVIAGRYPHRTPDFLIAFLSYAPIMPELSVEERELALSPFRLPAPYLEVIFRRSPAGADRHSTSPSFRPAQTTA